MHCGLWDGHEPMVTKVDGYGFKVTCLGVKMTKSGVEMVHLDFPTGGTYRIHGNNFCEDFCEVDFSRMVGNTMQWDVIPE